MEIYGIPAGINRPSQPVSAKESIQEKNFYEKPFIYRVVHIALNVVWFAIFTIILCLTGAGLWLYGLWSGRRDQTRSIP